MFDLILSTLFSVIALPEPAIAEDDTHDFVPVTLEPPVMHTRKIDLREVLTLDQLQGSLVAYYSERGAVPQIGHIRGVEESKFGRISLYFQPINDALLTKWRDLDDFVYVWFV